MGKHINLSEIFSDYLLQKARPYKDNVNLLEAQFIKPNIDIINKVTKQKNDSKYFAYVLSAYLNGALK